MFQKFRDKSDDELVFAYKAKKDDDIELELIQRYRIHAKKISGEFCHKYSFLYQIEFEDIFSIAISCLFTSMKTFSKRGFFKYWKTYTTNELLKYIKKFTLTTTDAIVLSRLNVEELSKGILLKQNPYNMDDDQMQSEVFAIIDNKANMFGKHDKSIFMYHLEGYKTKEIAVLVNRKESFVRERLKVIKSKIADILFNQ